MFVERFIVFLQTKREKTKNMEVKDIFELRKQGRIEEAYDAIRPMYAVHKGKYTTLAMFWTASDMLKKRLGEKRVEEAQKIFEALLRVLPSIDDRDSKAHAAVVNAALRLGKEVENFSMLQFLEQFGAEHLTEADWKPVIPEAKEAAPSGERKFPLPSNALRILTLAFHDLQRSPTPERALKVMPLLQEALRRHPRDKNVVRHMAQVYVIMQEPGKAAELYRQLLTRHHDSWLYAELAELTEEPGERAALLIQAITRQRQDKFRSGYHFELAQLLAGRDNARAAYELERCISIRQQQGFHNTREIEDLRRTLADAQPVDEASQQAFYRKMKEKYFPKER